MIADPERYANEYELDAKANIDSKRESGSVSIVAMRLWLRAAHAVVELTGPADGDGKTFGSDGNISLWLHESDLALGNILLNRISKENAKLGVGTCHDVGDLSDFCCSECGIRMYIDTGDTYTMIADDGCTIIKHPNYCPNCGRKVVDE